MSRRPRPEPPVRVAFTPAEVGQRLGMSAWSVRKLIRDGQLRAVPAGTRYRVPVKALGDYLGLGPDELRAYLAGASS